MGFFKRPNRCLINVVVVMGRVLLLGSSNVIIAGHSRSLAPSYSGVIVCELKPSILATGFLFVLA